MIRMIDLSAVAGSRPGVLHRHPRGQRFGRLTSDDTEMAPQLRASRAFVMCKRSPVPCAAVSRCGLTPCMPRGLHQSTGAAGEWDLAARLLSDQWISLGPHHRDRVASELAGRTSASATARRAFMPRSRWHRDAHAGGGHGEPATSHIAITDARSGPTCCARISADRLGLANVQHDREGLAE